MQCVSGRQTNGFHDGICNANGGPSGLVVALVLVGGRVAVAGVPACFRGEVECRAVSFSFSSRRLACT